MKKLQTKIKKLLSPAVFMAAFGLVVGGSLFAAPAVQAACDTSGGVNLSSGIGCAQGDDQPTELFGDGGIFTKVVNVLLFLVGIISVIMIIIGGIRYSTSNGDQGAITAAKNTIMYAVIGLVVAILAFAIVNFVTGSFLGDQ